MALNTYDGLKMAICAHLDRDDLTQQVDDFICLAESVHKRDIRIKDMVVRESIAINDRHVALPAGLLEPLSLRCNTNPPIVLAELSLHEMHNYRRDSAGLPQYYTIYGDEIEFDVDPEVNLVGEIIYYRAMTPLSEGNQSNALLLASPDAYLYAALSASAPFLFNDERIEVWGSLYARAVGGLAALNQSGRRIGPLVARVAGATP